MKDGRGDAALFIHAWPLNGYQWREAIALLSEHYTCIAPDMLGLGYSEANFSEITPHSQVQMLAELIDELGIERVHVVGNDSGGAVAQLFAARFPDRIASLLLTNCDVAVDNPPESFQSLVKAAQNGDLVRKFIRPQLEDIAVARSPHGLVLAYSNPWFLTPDSVRIYLEPIVSSPERIEQFNRYTISLGENVLSAVENDLARLLAPSRILWGAADTFFSQADPDYLANVLSNCRGVRRIPGAKLYFPEEMPDVIAAEARQLWST